jgi:hypothetical protein
MSVVEANFEPQGQLFELPDISEGGGGITLTQTKKIAIDHESTAKLLKMRHSGEGHEITGTFRATIGSFTAGKGVIIWSAAVDELEVIV